MEEEKQVPEYTCLQQSLVYLNNLSDSVIRPYLRYLDLHVVSLLRVRNKDYVALDSGETVSSTADL